MRLIKHLAQEWKTVVTPAGSLTGTLESGLQHANH